MHIRIKCLIPNQTRGKICLTDILALLPIAAIVSSLKLRLVPFDDLTVSGEDTCVHFHAKLYGHKVCDFDENSSCALEQ